MVDDNKPSIGKLIVVIILIVSAFITVYPVWYILCMSLSGESHLISQDIYLLPKDFTFGSYIPLFQTKSVWMAYGNTVLYTVVGTAISLTTTVTLSYSVSQKSFTKRKIVIWFIMITMFFSGGILPQYILIQGLELMNTLWAIVLPGAVNAWNMIITRTYFMSISSSIFESAEIDGASEYIKLLLIGIPLAMPIIAVLSLYMIVGFWNTYFSSMLYLESVDKQPIQNYLQTLLTDGGYSAGGGSMSAISVEKLKYSSIVVTMFPIMAIYPFFQKYFVNGIMVGSIKE